MPRISTTQRLRDTHQEALRQFDEIQSAMRDERLQCLQDRRFYSIAGAQWEGPLQEQYENKPKFEVNKIGLAVQRIVNEYRNNRVTVDFVSKDGTPTEMASVCNRLFRADEQDSMANEAYDNAFEEAVGGGFGAWRLKTVYEDDEDPDNDRQRIRIEPIYDADTSVFFDLQAKRQDKADATKAFVLYSMTRDAYIAEFDDDPTSWPKEIYQTFFDWDTPDMCTSRSITASKQRTTRRLYSVDWTAPRTNT
jgi:Phage P22-like portal protein